MSEHIQMKIVADLKFPSIVFSPIATSSPKLTRMRAPIRDQSWTSSSDESVGNVTSRLLSGINESHMDTSKMGDVSASSSCSMYTALEFVDPTAFKKKTMNEVITREELRSAISDFKMKEDNYSKQEADLYATVVTERLLWTACRTWSGMIPVEEKDDLNKYIRYACEDFYMRCTGQLCTDELQHINLNGKYDWQSVALYCYEKGMPPQIIDRIFAKNLVRRTTGNYLDNMEMTWLIFAMIGTDEMQSIEYWFRVLDVQSVGVLSFTDLEFFYEQITQYLAKDNVTSLPFPHVIAQFIDILGTSEWTLRSFKKNIKLVFRVINGFVNAIRFLEQEINEKTNGERVDDEEFGQGHRTRWQRLIDHEYDDFYHQNNSSSSPESSSITN
ncbi:hypothetical protein GCK72_018239 [Caenorhabditis remanei]|uniref:EF-hand domain-containing protein n=1 Tax=Caenorhabditis remanei TaxID=31234 RepID=E3LQ40_CAERE|nr:hypothetical protein GCK72_018239 [Caenorhabditis remanei]EFP05431.1 hypothetical protein CRE_27080 [Caenorhabditis remanei]KAF1751685.1 hypothetical protein GCK72_018239 [Caenorhabditis remanei]